MSSRPNHISVHAHDLDVSSRFYEDVFGLRPIESFAFSTAVRWLRLGDLQLHLIQSTEHAPRSHHFAVEVDDYDRVYRRVEELGIREREIPLFSNVSELPDGSIQMFLRDPAGNLVEVVQRDAAAADRAAVDGLVRLADLVAQPARTSATLFLDADDAGHHRADGGARTPAEVFADHGRALLSRDAAAIAADYAEDAVLLTPSRDYLGRPAVREFFAGLLDQLPQASWTARMTKVHGDVVFHEWSADSPAGAIDDGIDTLLIRNGAIELQTVRYSWVGTPSGALHSAPGSGDAD